MKRSRLPRVRQKAYPPPIDTIQAVFSAKTIQFMPTGAKSLEIRSLLRLTRSSNAATPKAKAICTAVLVLCCCNAALRSCNTVTYEH